MSGSRAPFSLPALIAGLLLWATPFLSAQTLTLPEGGLYRPGRYVPLSVDVPQAGLVRIRGDAVQGIDLPAAGRGRISVPLMIYRTTPGPLTLTVNGRPQVVDVVPLGETDPVPDALHTSADPIVPQGPQSAAIDPGAYDRILSWTPGQSPAARAFVFRMTLISLLLLGAALHVRKTPSVVLMTLVSAGVVGGAAIFMPPGIARREVPIGDSGASWIWRASPRAATITESFGDPAGVPATGDRSGPRSALWFIPRSADALARQQPVLQCDARGRPIAIAVRLGDDDRAVFVGLRSPASAR
ncbi:MAG: hypothetical protein ACTHLZ_17700 [Tepidisphaeraceae bacterium]